MISKDKMFIVSNIIDDSIKSAIVMYDITIFPTFEALEKYISEYPVVVNTIIVPEMDLSFTSNNMQRLRDIIEAPFAKITGKVFYLIPKNIKEDVVKSFLEDYGLENVIVYQSDITAEYITDIAAGIARDSYESDTEIVTYRVRAKEYHAEVLAKRYETDDAHYISDEEELAGIPDIQEPFQQIPSVEREAEIKYFIGERGIDRTLFAWLSAQYLKINARVLIIENDWEFHRMTDMVLKSSVECLFLTIEDFMKNPKEYMDKMRTTPHTLTVIGTKERGYFDYDFFMDILISNMRGDYDYIIREGGFSDTPFAYKYTIVSGSTIPEVLSTVSKLDYELDESRVSWVALQSRELGNLAIDSVRLRDLLAVTTGKENINAEVFRVEGINFSGGTCYDFRSIVG